MVFALNLFLVNSVNSLQIVRQKNNSDENQKLEEI